MREMGKQREKGLKEGPCLSPTWERFPCPVLKSSQGRSWDAIHATLQYP